MWVVPSRQRLRETELSGLQGAPKLTGEVELPPGRACRSRPGRASTREGILGVTLVPSLPGTHVICVPGAQLQTLTS